MTFNKKVVTAAVGASLVLASGAAQAFRQANFNSLLFPYVVKETNRTTVITVIGTSESRTTGNQDLHIQYWTKSTTDANTAACQPSSTFMGITPSDIVSFDTAGVLGYPLFGDTTNAAPLGASIGFASPRHGYLLVDDLSDQLAGGYWMEIDLANGGAFGGAAAGNYDDTSYNNFDDGGFSLQDDSVGSANDSSPVIFWPATIASTVFTVTPLGNNMRDSDNTSVVMQVYNENQVQGAYDRNENGVDGTVPQTVRCVGRLTAAQLMPGVVANAAWAAQGGWGYLANLGDGDVTSNENCASGTGDCDAIVYQVDSSNAAGSGRFMSNATMISTDTNGYDD